MKSPEEITAPPEGRTWEDRYGPHDGVAPTDYALRCRARVAVHRALAAGTLKRGPCQGCGDLRARARHEDPAKPLDVAWLCRRCEKLKPQSEQERTPDPCVA